MYSYIIFRRRLYHLNLPASLLCNNQWWIHCWGWLGLQSQLWLTGIDPRYLCLCVVTSEFIVLTKLITANSQPMMTIFGWRCSGWKKRCGLLLLSCFSSCQCVAHAYIYLLIFFTLQFPSFFNPPFFYPCRIFKYCWYRLKIYDYYFVLWW